jgi:hypothetical protein
LAEALTVRWGNSGGAAGGDGNALVSSGIYLSDLSPVGVVKSTSLS